MTMVKPYIYVEYTTYHSTMVKHHNPLISALRSSLLLGRGRLKGNGQLILEKSKRSNMLDAQCAMQIDVEYIEEKKSLVSGLKYQLFITNSKVLMTHFRPNVIYKKNLLIVFLNDLISIMS